MRFTTVCQSVLSRSWSDFASSEMSTFVPKVRRQHMQATRDTCIHFTSFLQYRDVLKDSKQQCNINLTYYDVFFKVLTYILNFYRLSFNLHCV